VLPVTQKEKQKWRFVAFSAGITEELLYRGYLFLCLGRVISHVILNSNFGNFHPIIWNWTCLPGQGSLKVNFAWIDFWNFLYRF